MQNPLFKLSALIGVISAGVMVVVEAQKHLAVPHGDDAQVFTQLTGGEPGDPTATPAASAPTTGAVSPSAASPAQATEQAIVPVAAEISVRGPSTTSLAAPAQHAEPDAEPFPFLYSAAPPASRTPTPAAEPTALAAQSPEPEEWPIDVTLPAGPASQVRSSGNSLQGFLADTAEPTPEPIMLLTAEQSVPVEASGAIAPTPSANPGTPTPLKKFAAEVGTPLLLSPPTPPRPPQQADEEPEPTAGMVSFAQFADAVVAELEDGFDPERLLVLPAGAESTSGDATADGSEPRFAQAGGAPAPRERSRAPAPQPAPAPVQNEPLDLFGPLPTNNTSNPPAGTTDDLVLPPSQPPVGIPASDDPFGAAAPAPIPGTEVNPSLFPSEIPPSATPRSRANPTPANPDSSLVPTPAATPAPVQPSAAPEQDPFPDLFLPQPNNGTPAPAPAQPEAAPAFPSFSLDDPRMAPAAEQPIPGRAPASDFNARNRGDRPVQPVQPAAADTPFFSPESETTIQPRRTAEPVRSVDPFPTTPAGPSGNSIDFGAQGFPQPSPEPIRSSIPVTLPAGAPPGGGSLPSFPTANDLDPFPALTQPPTPQPGSQPPQTPSFPTPPAPTPTMTPRSSIPDQPQRVEPQRSPSTTFPQPGDLSGTGVIDVNAPTGAQPELQIEKDAPPKAVLNQPLVYNIRVRNIGRTAAHQVVVEDSIPRGSTLKGTIPEAELDPQDKHLIWRFGTLAPQEEKLIRVQIVPTEPGEIGSVATVRFVGRIASKTVITAPRVKLEMNGPVETAVGDTPLYRFRVSNHGDGDASEVLVKSTVPALFQHPSGTELEYEVGALQAGQTREFELALSAVRAGQATNAVSVLVGGQEHDRVTGDMVVLASRLSIERTGPERRFVNRPANYVTQVTNQSSDALRSVTIVETLPSGMELAAVPEHGRYDPSRRTITWVLPQLGPQETKQLRSVLVTADPGSYATSVLVTADPGSYATSVRVWDAAGNKAEATSQLQVAGFSSLKMDVAQTTQGGGEVAVGEQVALRMTVANRGSAAASDVVTEFEIPPELEFVAARPQQYTLQDRKIRFETMPHMDVNAQQVIDIVCVARQPGTPRIAASIWSKEQNPIRQEEAVVVFREEP